MASLVGKEVRSSDCTDKHCVHHLSGAGGATAKIRSSKKAQPSASEVLLHTPWREGEAEGVAMPTFLKVKYF
jgi:hypothetical protein